LLSSPSSSRKQSIVNKTNKNKNKNSNKDENSNNNNNNNNNTNNKEDHIVDGAIRVEIPTELDILCGQSRICASHTGNKRFQTVLDTYATRYDNATSKQEKMIMTKEVVACIHNSNGRFLKYKNNSNNEDGDGIWEEISNVAARDKVSHALRTKVSSWKRQQQQLLLQAKDDNNNNNDGVAAGSGGRRRSSMSKSRHRKGGVGRNRRSSSSSFASNASDIMTNSFDGGSDSTAVVNDLMKAQRQIFATLTTSSSSTVVVAAAVTAETPTTTTTCIKSEQPLLELVPGAINNDHHDFHDLDIEPHHPLNTNRIPCRRSSSYF
jgi:hypothetical protein